MQALVVTVSSLHHYSKELEQILVIILPIFA